MPIVILITPLSADWSKKFIARPIYQIHTKTSKRHVTSDFLYYWKYIFLNLTTLQTHTSLSFTKPNGNLRRVSSCQSVEVTKCMFIKDRNQIYREEEIKNTYASKKKKKNQKNISDKIDRDRPRQITLDSQRP